MSILLVQGCSKSKNRPGGAVPALDLYSGYFFRIIKKAIREDEFDDRIDISILSAEYGLIDADHEITWYDRKMDTERARELAPAVQQTLKSKLKKTYEMAIINVGGTYRHTLDGIESTVQSKIHHINGAGIGEKGHLLKQVIRGDLQAAAPDSAMVKS